MGSRPRCREGLDVGERGSVMVPGRSTRGQRRSGRRRCRTLVGPAHGAVGHVVGPAVTAITDLGPYVVPSVMMLAAKGRPGRQYGCHRWRSRRSPGSRSGCGRSFRPRRTGPSAPTSIAAPFPAARPSWPLLARVGAAGSPPRFGANGRSRRSPVDGTRLGQTPKTQFLQA